MLAKPPETTVTVTIPSAISERMRDLHRYMRLTRACDDAIVRLYRQGKMVGGAYTGRGNEATAVGSAFALAAHDYLLPMHRDLGAHLVKGQSLRNIFLQLLGRDESLTRGRDGTGHYADPALRIFGNVSHLAAMIPFGVGIALASQLRHEPAVVMNYIGDGGSNVGDFHEGLNMAAVMKLPFVLIIQNNQYAYSTPVSKQIAAKSFSDRAIGYGIPGFTIDGTDVMAVYETSAAAVERARCGEGPTIVECVTMRMHGHSASDDSSYVPTALLEKWAKKDPVETFEKRLLSEAVLTPASIQELEARIHDEIEDAISYAEGRPYPPGEQAAEGVFAP